MSSHRLSPKYSTRASSGEPVPARSAPTAALAAAVPGAFVAETTLDAPFDQVWAVAADLEHELPAYLPDVRSFIVTRRDGERLQAHARGYAGLRAHFDIVLRPGWCVMRSRFLLGGLAAVPDGQRTFGSSAACTAQHARWPRLTAFGNWAAPGVSAVSPAASTNAPGPAAP
jgi:hypothetical protein